MKFIFITFLFFITSALFASEQLIKITAISSTLQTFVTTQGSLDGMVEGKRALFSTDQISVKAYATTVTAAHTVWKIEGDRFEVPFEKGETVVYNSAPDQIWYSISKAKSFYYEESKRANLQSYFLARGALSRSFSESVTYTQPMDDYTRGGYSGELQYQKELTKVFSVAGGIRLDNEVSTDGTIEALSQRYYLIADITYNFPDFGKTFISNYYITLGGGIGTSSTTINDEVITGNSIILPYIRLGFVSKTSRKNSFFIESTAEGVSTKESFSTGEVQTTDTINGKIAIGWRRTL